MVLNLCVASLVRRHRNVGCGKVQLRSLACIVRPDMIGQPMRALLVLFLAFAAAPAHAADGAHLFDDQCASCHSLGAASTIDGPSLKGVIWRRVAAVPDFTYTPALASIGGSWSPSRLDEFLKDTQALAPGSGMFIAIADPADRQAIISYLKTAR